MIVAFSWLVRNQLNPDYRKGLIGHSGRENHGESEFGGCHAKMWYHWGSMGISPWGGQGPFWEQKVSHRYSFCVVKAVSFGFVLHQKT